MNYIKKIEIENFRGLASLHIEELNQINIFVGKNNSGKSSILEALFLLIGMSNPGLPDSINGFRGLVIKGADEFKYLFHKLKLANNPEFKCIFSNSDERNLKLSPIFKKSNNELYKKIEGKDEFSMDASTASPRMTGLELSFSYKKRHSQRKSFKSSIHIDNTGISQNINNKYKEELHAVFIAGDSKEANALSRYSEIVKRKKSDIILDALKKIDPKIEAIYPLPDGLFFSYVDIEELIPINISGDGVRRYLNIVTTIAEKSDSIILIDEIENGLHFSAHKLLWESLINIASEFNTQLFITTHNIETLKCVKELAEEKKYEDLKDKLSVFNVSHTKKSGIKTYKYSYKGLVDAIETGTEIR